jgi:hypothetical protein
VSAPTPPPDPPARKLGRVDFIFLALFFGAIIGALLWALRGATPFWDFSDDGVVIDGRHETDEGNVAEYGRIYSQAQLALAPETELVLPLTQPERWDGLRPRIAVEIRTEGVPGTVRVLIEARIGLVNHGRVPRRLRDLGRGTGVWKRQQGSVLALGVDPGWMHLTGGGESVRAIFVIPTSQRTRQEGPSSPEFVSRYKGYEAPWVISNEETKAAGWEEVPLQPLSHTQFR